MCGEQLLSSKFDSARLSGLPRVLAITASTAGQSQGQKDAGGARSKVIAWADATAKVARANTTLGLYASPLPPFHIPCPTHDQER